MTGRSFGLKAITLLWRIMPTMFLILMILTAWILGGMVSREKERLAAEKAAETPNGRPVISVVVMDLEPTTVRDVLSMPGEVEPWVDLTVKAEVGGKVLELPVTEGANVNKGDVIARLDPRDYENELESLLARHELALKTLGRAENLHAKQIVPETRLDEARAEERVLRASIDNARLRLERAEIKAPISGVLNRLDVEVGKYVNAMDPVGRIIEIGRVKVRVGIPESDVDAVRGLQSFTLEFEALGGRRLTGTRHYLSKAPETMAHLYMLEIALDNPRAEILPGMFANVTIVKQQKASSVAVPLYSVITRNEGRFVMVEEGGVARVRAVETGILDGWNVEITRGLKPGEGVIVVGHRGVDEGQPVSVERRIKDPGELYE